MRLRNILIVVEDIEKFRKHPVGFFCLREQRAKVRTCTRPWRMLR